MRAQLAVDVMQMIAKSLRGDTESAGNRCGIIAFCEQREDPPLLFRERTHRCVTGRRFSKLNKLSGYFYHACQQLFVAMPLIDIVHQAHEQLAAGSRVVVNDRGNIDPQLFGR